MKLQYFFYALLGGLIGYGRCQIASVILTFENPLLTNNGLGWPPQLNVTKGNEALMKLRTTLSNMQSCTVTDPSGAEFDVRQPQNNRYERWSEGCGVRVKGINGTDQGRWRLTAVRDGRSITGWIEVNVLEDTAAYSPAPISLLDGVAHAQVSLSSLDNAYCVVAKPFAESALVPGRCRVTLDRATRAVQGTWDVYLGLPGRVAELQASRRVTVQTERLDVGYVHDASNKLHLYCNILHSAKEITFCRFQRTSNSYGYNVIDGLSDGNHSYYGDGFALQQCGMTIESPAAEDYVTWRCSVGVQTRVGNVVQQQTPMQSLISVSQNFRTLESVQRSDDEEPPTIFVQKDTSFTLRCSAGVSLAYCWFLHPNGSQFTPVPLTDEGQPYWYTGESLQAGDCGMTFVRATAADDGEWACFLGPRAAGSAELRRPLRVQTGGALGGPRRVRAARGATAELRCRSANGRRPLRYCRFLSPQLVGMNLDPSVTAENPILERFYFTPNRSLEAGDCSLSVGAVRDEDFGEWGCAALLDDEPGESRHGVLLYKDEAASGNRRLQAGMAGAAAGVVALGTVLGGWAAYRRWGWPRWGWARRAPRAAGAVSFSYPSGSVSSGSSNGEATIIRPSI